jgi:sugar lactone lactonase YvrE
MAPQTHNSSRSSKTLYVANSGQELLGKVKVNDDGSAAGEFEVVAANTGPGDDFTIDSKAEYAFLMVNEENTLLRVRLDDGVFEIAAGGLNSTLLPGPTSCKFGKGSDKDVLFVTNSGAGRAPIDGFITEPGSVVRVELAKLGVQV